MSSLSLSINPRTTSGGGGGNYYVTHPIRRTRSFPTKVPDTRMTMVSSIPASSTRRSRKSYTQTLVEQRNKSKLQQKQQKKQRLVRSSSIDSRKYKRGGGGLFRSSTPMAFLYTSAEKDPTLARNKYNFFGRSNSNNNNNNNNNHSSSNNAAAADDRTDIGTTRTNQESTRDDNDDNKGNKNDPPKEVTIKSPKPEKDLIDIIGEAVIEANDAIVATVCDNKAITKTIFPYIDGDYYDPNVVNEREFEEEKVNDFYGGYMGQTNNCTLEMEGFEATPNACRAAGTNDKVAPAVASGGGGALSIGKFGSMLVGTSWAWRGARQKKGGNLAEAESAGTESTNEGQEVKRGQADSSSANTAEVLLCMYDPALDMSSNTRGNKCSNKQVKEEGTIVDGQDLELEMMDDRNVMALGFGAFAVCGGDENTIITSDQRELTLQDAVLEDDIMETRMDKLPQQKRSLLGRMKARNLRAVKKELRKRSDVEPSYQNGRSGDAANGPSSKNRTQVESKNDAKEHQEVVTAQAVFAAFNTSTSEDPVKEGANGSFSKNSAEVERKNDTPKSEQQEVVNAQAVLAAFNTDTLLLKSFEVDDGISMQSSISMATDLRSNNNGPESPRSRRSKKDTEDASRSAADAESKDTEDESIGTEESHTEENETPFFAYPALWWKWLTS
ncbi:hypothetical protein ACHAWT_000947 [Skeletonema menzelii]